MVVRVVEMGSFVVVMGCFGAASPGVVSLLEEISSVESSWADEPSEDGEGVSPSRITDR